MRQHPRIPRLQPAGVCQCVRLELCESEFFDNILANSKKEAKEKAIKKFRKRYLKDKNIEVDIPERSPNY